MFTNACRAGFALILAMLLVAGAALAQTSSAADLVDVIVGFRESPAALSIGQLGGHITMTYMQLPMIAARIPASAVKSLQDNPAVSFIEPDRLVYASSQIVPWNIVRIGARDSHLYLGVTGAGVKVAVLDTGIDPDHPDLVVWGGADFTNSGYWHDDNGHGTHVAGILAARHNNTGVLGVAPDAQLYSVKVLTSIGSGTSSMVAAGIEWAALNGIRIINMSLEAPFPSTAIEQACQLAWNSGVLLVAAAGNTGCPCGMGDNIQYPARYDTVIAVGATCSSDQRAYFSSTGPTLELMAPGVSILSTYPGGGLEYESGTSMAAPHVSGVAALLMQANPDWTAMAVRGRLQSTAESIGNGNASQYGLGLVDALHALSGPRLHVEVITNKRTYWPGQTIRITVFVRDGFGQSVSGANVSLTITTPPGQQLTGFEAMTGDKGSVTFPFQPTPQHGFGTYTIRADACKTGYAPGHATCSCRVGFW